MSDCFGRDFDGYHTAPWEENRCRECVNKTDCEMLCNERRFDFMEEE